MALPVNKIVLIILFISISLLSKAQNKSWHPEFQSRKIHTFRKTEMNLTDYLSDGVSHVIADNNCKVYQSNFFFRVDYLGKVDSISHNHGSLTDEMTTKIVQNILSTEGHWKIPKKTKKVDFCWFIYPFIDVGLNSECYGNEEILQSHLIQTLYLLTNLQPITKTHHDNYFIIAPTLLGDPFSRE